MRSVTVLLLVVACLVGIGASAWAAGNQGATSGPEQWRYTWHNGEWWYWLPEGRWVYWRGNRWNDYNPQAFVPSTASPAVGVPYQGPTYYGYQAQPNSEIRPFYGHALSEWGSGLSSQNEIGPFYGHAMPGEVLGGWGGRRSSIRPFYGHATSGGY